MKNPDFSISFQAGKRFDPKLREIILTPSKIGELVLTSGKLIACDPLTYPDTEPFAADLIPGSYPVILSVAHYQKDSSRVAYAMLRLSEQTPIRWEMATRPGEDLSSLSEAEGFGYAVESGTGCFMDMDAAQVIDASLEAETFEDSLGGKLLEALEKNYKPTWDWAVLRVDDSTEANVIAFTTGWGDGAYPSYFGYDAEDNIVNLVTDFGLFGGAEDTIFDSS